MVRKTNRVIQLWLKRSFRPIQNGTIYKLVEASEERFKDYPSCNEEVSASCQSIVCFYIDVITKILEMSLLYDSKTEEGEEEIISEK